MQYLFFSHKLQITSFKDQTASNIICNSQAPISNLNYACQELCSDWICNVILTTNKEILLENSGKMYFKPTTGSNDAKHSLWKVEGG